MNSEIDRSFKLHYITSQRIPRVSIRKTKRLLLYRKTVSVYYVLSTTHVYSYTARAKRIVLRES